MSVTQTKFHPGDEPPVLKAQIFNTALPAANSNLLGADLTPTNPICVFKIYVNCSISGNLIARRTRGGTTVSETLGALTAATSANFAIPVDTGEAINFWLSTTTGTMVKLQVTEARLF